METKRESFLWIHQPGQLPKDAYEERCKAYRYSITFCGGAVAFLALAKNDFGADYPSELLGSVLAVWGLAIFAGFAVLNLSLREVWMYQRLPDTSWLKRCRCDLFELFLLGIMMLVHIICVLTGVAVTAFLLLRSL